MRRLHTRIRGLPPDGAFARALLRDRKDTGGPPPMSSSRQLQAFLGAATSPTS